MDTLAQLRTKIDDIDNHLVEVLVERFSVVMDIWRYKKQHNLPALDEERQRNMLEKIISLWNKKWLSKDFIGNVRNLIHQESLKIQ